MPSFAGKEILVVDDMKDVLTTARLILESEGATLLVSETVDEALSLANKKIPHLIITDLQMPGKNGFDLLKFRRNSPDLKEIPTLVLSGMTDRQSVREAIALGADDYILKPIRAALLLQKCRKWLRIKSFLKHHFENEILPQASVSIPSDIKKLSEVSLQLEASVKLSSDATVLVSGEPLTKLKFGELVCRTTHLPPGAFVKGRYYNELRLVGLDEKAIKVIRSKVKEPKGAPSGS